MYQQNKSSESKLKFRRASNRYKSVLEAVKLAHATKTKEPITSQKLGFPDFWRIANSIPNKGKCAISLLFNGPEVMSSTSDKAKLFAKNFSKDSDLDGLGIFLPDFLSRTNMKLNNISITPKMVKKVKLLNNRIVDYLEKSGLFLISSMVLDLLDQLQFF